MEVSVLRCFSLPILILFLATTLECHDLNIVYIFADDLGWNDIGYHNPDIMTPNIDKLAKEGLILDQSYAQAVCSPSRSAFMTGVYPFRLGLQHSVILDFQDVCVPKYRMFMSQVFQAAGYATHAVGKWHLGYCNKHCTPTYRGFDTFYGYYTAGEDHYTKMAKMHMTYEGYDFRDNEKVDWSAAGIYSSYLYRARIKKIIANHNTSKPLFMYLPFQNVHFPLEVPKKYYDMYPNIKSEGRRKLSGMSTALDDSVGVVVDSLKAKGIYDNTLIVFSADNGGSVNDYGNNYPLRGGKETVFEGGTRVTGFLHGPMFKRNGLRYQGMMHVVDWFPTLVEAAGIGYKGTDQDGVSQWQSLLTLSVPSNREELVYNIDNNCGTDPICEGAIAIRYQDFKLIDGYPGFHSGWYKPGETSVGLGLNVTKTVETKFLFNVKDDPNERVNLFDKYPNIVKSLRERLEIHQKKYVPANFPGVDPKSNPQLYGGAWSPGWC